MSRLRIIVGLSLLVMSALNAGITDEYCYSRACLQAQRGDWQATQESMNTLMVDFPDQPDVIYDNGVAAYRLKDYEKAQTYFQEAAKKPTASLGLRKCAHFNLGNTAVALKKFDDAIKQYEEVLRIDPNDEYAKHNLEQVKKLLEQEQKNGQNQQQRDKQQKGDQQKDSGKQGPDKQKGQSGEQQPQHDKGSDRKQERGDGKQQHDESPTGQHQEEQDKGEDDDERDEGSNANNGSDEDDGEDGEQDSTDRHGTSQEESEQQKNSGSDDTKASQKEQAMQSGTTQKGDDRKEREQKKLAQQFSDKEQWMLKALERRERDDEKMNKHIIKATIDKKMPGSHGKNNW